MTSGTNKAFFAQRTAIHLIFSPFFSRTCIFACDKSNQTRVNRCKLIWVLFSTMLQIILALHHRAIECDAWVPRCGLVPLFAAAAWCTWIHVHISRSVFVEQQLKIRAHIFPLWEVFPLWEPFECFAGTFPVLFEGKKTLPVITTFPLPKQVPSVRMLFLAFYFSYQVTLWQLILQGAADRPSNILLWK